MNSRRVSPGTNSGHVELTARPGKLNGTGSPRAPTVPGPGAGARGAEGVVGPGQPLERGGPRLGPERRPAGAAG